MKITAAVVPVRSAQFELQTLDLAGPLADEVLVRVVASGMCHTDLHARDGYFPNLPYPVVCGHEGAGIVEQAGGAVTDLAPGDPVVISFPWCGECDRDRGTPHGATPPTPPGIRVTYHGGSTGLSLGNDMEAGETEGVKIVVAQG